MSDVTRITTKTLERRTKNMFLPLKPTQDQIQAVGQAMVNSGYVNLEQIIADEQSQWLFITIPNCPVCIKMKVMR